MTQMNHPAARQRGFTLIELVMVIVILGVISGMVAVFMKGPIDAYFSTGRRAALTDVADTTVRRIARDIRTALPNSIALTGSQCLEFIPTKTGGRYRVQDKAAGDDTSLNFSSADTTFNMLGSNQALPASQQIGRGDLIVVYNLGIAGASALANDNWIKVSETAPVPLTESPAAATPPPAPVETTIPLSGAGFKFPLESGSNRFHVVPGAERLVTYRCSGNQLYRLVNASSFASSCTGTPTGPVIASNVDCTTTTFNYSGSDLQRNALVSMRLTMQDSSATETVTLQQQVHVNNTP